MVLGWQLGLAVLAVLILCGVAEAVALRGYWAPYHKFGFALAEPLRDLPGMPPEAGASPALRWRRLVAEGGVAFQARNDARRAPRGMHGWVSLRERPGGGVALGLVWAPLWTPCVAFAWLTVLGLIRREPAAAVAGAALLGLYVAAHLNVARTAAAELRWAFLRADSPGEGADQPSQSGRPS